MGPLWNLPVLQGRRWLKILAADPVDPVCAQTFADAGHKLVEKKLTREQLLEQIGQYDGLVVRSGVKVTEDVSGDNIASSLSVGGKYGLATGGCGLDTA